MEEDHLIVSEDQNYLGEHVDVDDDWMKEVVVVQKVDHLIV